LMRIPLRRPAAVVAVAALLLVPSAATASEDAATQGVGPSAAAEASSADARAVAEAPAAAAKNFTFYGSGFGHGLGMSQWGAFGLAREGWAAARILEHFYSGTGVSAAAGPARLRIGLLQTGSDVRLEAISGPVKIKVGDAQTGDVVATVPSGATWHVRVADTRYRIVDAQGTTVARVGGPNTPIFAVFGGARIRVPEAGHTYNRGVIEFGLFSCGGTCDMRLVLVIEPEEYLYGLGEVPSSWPMEALKAQAIAARTYAFTKARAGQHRSGCDCALYATSFDQVYSGYDKEGGVDGDRWVRAVNATEGKTVKDGGATIQAFYMSSSGGHTEDNENVWGGTPIGYLRGVCDPGDYTEANPSAIWDVTIDAGEVTTDLSLGIGVVTGFGSVSRGVSGRIISIVVKGQDGQERISGGTLRSQLALRDDRVWVNSNRQIVGAIRQKYDALRCSPGLPLSRQLAVAGGSRQRFQDATIFFHDATGAHEVHGPVLAAYLDAGGPGGNLGFPQTDVQRRADGRLRSRFQHGTITCGDTTCRVVTD
jgi:stage II sporulation protein D